MNDNNTKNKKQNLLIKILFHTGLFLLIFFAIVGIFCCFSVISTLVSLSNTVRSIDVNNRENILAIEKMAGITFPDGILWLKASDIGFQDYYVKCKFRANEHDIQLMFADNLISWSDTERFVHNTPSLAWFTPNSVKIFKSAQVVGSKQNTSSVRILYGIEYDDDNNTDKPLTVYMEIIYL